MVPLLSSLLGIALVTVGTSGSPYYECPNGTIRHGSSCYLIGHLMSNWPDSLVYCEAYLGHLVHIETAEEQQYVASMVRNFIAVSTDPAKYFWMGGTDAVSEGEWIWEKTTDRIQFTNWAPGNPNNADGHSDHHQDCMAMYGETGLWDDGYCETQHNFLCEIELDVEVSGIVG